MRTQFPDRRVHYLAADFSRPLALTPLDGIVMANSLHFIKHADKERVLRQIIDYLKPGGRFLTVNSSPMLDFDPGVSYRQYGFEARVEGPLVEGAPIGSGSPSGLPVSSSMARRQRFIVPPRSLTKKIDFPSGAHNGFQSSGGSSVARTILFGSPLIAMV